MAETATSDAFAAQTAESARQFISFTVGGEEYGVDIMAIREIKGWTPATLLPEAPDYVRGVIDLRGVIVPIIDMRTRFHGGTTEATPRHVILVVAIDGAMVGLLADAVVDIVTVAATDIQPIPEMDHRQHCSFLAGIVSVEGRMVVVLDLHHLLDNDPAILAQAQA
ncbi:chemotaxis protein CheW [Paramagnetospirillum marisnigri]|uniref:Chemotaxis protein CheW n=1 Tax=Paramagnetospirillum marisnigri TaxID=1285242 RepID=A0A178MW57_9PROT|nr:chemotaxis protein CheW [Paramagnetospirillum marisnigri]OAN54584.1 chemotaxis protein CheW [Paramagnetospirillum marisnigri]